MKARVFWSHFEERTENEFSSATGLLGGTRTQTATREEDDQDFSHDSYGMNLGTISATTMTVTNTREELDQDHEETSYRAIQTRFSTGTKTVTKAAREESDQDAESQGYQTLPVDQS